MCNVVTKIVIAGAIMFGVLSCGNNDRDAANNLLTQAEESIETRQYSIAVALLDSIDNCYPREIDVRRKAMNLRPKAIEGKTLRDIEQNDSLIAVMQGLFKEMESNFVKISNPQLVEPYIVAKKANKSILDKNGIQARITPDGDFYVIYIHIVISSVIFDIIIIISKNRFFSTYSDVILYFDCYLQQKQFVPAPMKASQA